MAGRNPKANSIAYGHIAGLRTKNFLHPKGILAQQE
jgi:hypothetical protein